MGKLYKFSHKVGKGGFHFSCNIKDNKKILTEKIKDRLKEILEKFISIYKMEDVTIKIYTSNFHFFFAINPKIATAHFADSVLRATNGKLKKEFNIREDIWSKDYYLGSIYNYPDDVQKIVEILNTKNGKIY